MFRRPPLPPPIDAPPRAGTTASPWRRRGATVLAALGAVGLGVAAGFAVTAATVRSDAIGATRVGPWRVMTDAGTSRIDPYRRARQAHTGEIPLAAAEGLTATAREDSAGHRLDGRCRYRIAGGAPAAPFWTLEAASTAGRPFDNPAGRQSFTSDDLLWDADGHFAVLLSPTAMPGNWLPSPGGGHLLLVLRLYDAGALTDGRVREAVWPSIEALGCP